MDIGLKLQQLEARLARIENSPRLSHASIDDTAVQVRDASGSLRGLVGVQADGTTAVNIVNGPPPPQPTDPIVTSVLGGVTASWDGKFTGGATLPLDWQRIEVHASTTNGFTPAADTLRATIETPQGSTVVIAADDPVHVRLLARSTSGTASTPSAQVGPMGPIPVVADDILDGVVTTLKLADDAVTQAKIAAAAVDSTALQDGAVLAAKLANAAVQVGKIADGAVLLNTLGGPLGDTASQRYADYFRDAAAWAQLSSSSGGTWSINTAATDTPSGGGKLIATGDVQLASKALIPQDSDTLYRVMVRVRATAQDPSGVATIYLGVVGVAEDGVTLVNRTGANSNTAQHYCCTAGGSLGTADGWKTYTGWIQGHSATEATAPSGPATDPRGPELTHADVRFLRPMVWLNFGKSTAAVMEVEAVTVEAIRTGVVGSTNLISGSVTAGAIAADAVTAGKIAADAVTAREIAAGSVTASEVAAGAITTDKLTVTGGANILTDPSFEGAYTDSLVAGSAFASRDTTKGNGSPSSLKIDAASGTPLYRSLPMTAVPALPGEQFHLGVDYWVSTSWVGTEISIHARWEDATGAVLSYGKVVTASPVRDTWTRLSGSVTAPASTVTARFRVESGSATAGTVWWDNAAVRPVLGGTQIQDGAVTTQKVVAGAIQTAQLDAGAVNADKIASGAVTTAKLDALAVTSDKIAANAITASKIVAGAVDAIALAADAITGKTITGGTITGSVLQTDTAGPRVTINEGDVNKVLIYDGVVSSAIGELSDRGLLLQGTNGSLIWLDPDNTYPNLLFTNAAQTNSAVINVSANTAGAADLGLNSGTFSGSGFTDMKWRNYFGNDFAVVERLRNDGSSTVIGGRMELRNNFGAFGYVDTTGTTQGADVVVTPGAAKTRGRHVIQPYVGDTNSVLFLQPGPSHTGHIIRYWDPDNSVYRFAVDRSGNCDINGILTAGNVAAGRVTITPVANTPTSQNVTGLTLKGTNIRVVACAATSVPGTQVTGVGVTNQSATGFTVWVTRTNTTNTNIDWIAYGV
ncbi:hypothetical protein ACFYQT_39985 [Streptomyces tibetensis]|uniref:Uncharacterized protein n=1 Tax=Streptomyces tibetensis TaxID=2382123 RepID=A0ABW6N8G9_9ACTN